MWAVALLGHGLITNGPCEWLAGERLSGVFVALLVSIVSCIWSPTLTSVVAAAHIPSLIAGTCGPTHVSIEWSWPHFHKCRGWSRSHLHEPYGCLWPHSCERCGCLGLHSCVPLCRHLQSHLCEPHCECLWPNMHVAANVACTQTLMLTHMRNHQPRKICTHISLKATQWWICDIQVC